MGSDELYTLIARTAMDDRAAFAELYRRTNTKLFGICLRILKDRGEAEQALQDIYVRIWQRADRYSAERASPIAWLVAIARNHAIDLLRARQPVAAELAAAELVSDTAPTPEAAALRRAERVRIDDCLEELAPARAAAVREAYVEGYSYNELAQMHDVPLNTMRTWLRRSLLSLRACLER